MLPRLIAIGDPDIGERIGGALDPLDLADDIPPAIEPLARQLLLARLVRAEGESAAEAMRLADELARTMDALAIEEIPAVAVDRSGCETRRNLPAHWLQSIERFRAVLDRWPEILAERGVIDLADRRSRLLHSLADRWAERPPEGFTLAAGITTSAPAIAAVLARVARLENGAVILPALADARAMPAEEWDALGPDEDGRGEETHPQYHLKRLLDRIGIGRDEVRPWRGGGRAASSAARGRAVVNAMAAADFSDKWTRLSPPERRLTGIRVAELPDPASEAQAIAIALARGGRDARKDRRSGHARSRPCGPRVGASAALGDRGGRQRRAGRCPRRRPGRCCWQLQRRRSRIWRRCRCLRLLKHPLVGGEGDERLAWLEAVRALDLALRGPRPRAGIEGLDERFAEKKAGAAWRTVRSLLLPLAELGWQA